MRIDDRRSGLVSLASLAMLVACGGPCENTYDRMTACGPADAKDRLPSKDEFVRQCKAEMDKVTDPVEKQFNAELAPCADKTACSAYEACMQSVTTRRRRGETLTNIRAAMESRSFDDALMDCRVGDEEYAGDEEISVACTELRTAAFDALVSEVTKIRDDGSDSISKCVELEGVAETLSDAAKSQAKSLCEEASAAERAKEAIDESRANVQAKKPDIPTSCTLAMADLEPLTTAWGTAKREEVAKACYLDLGRVILPAKVPQMRYVCDYQVQTVYKAVKTYRLKDPQLDPWIQKSSELCEKAG